MSSFDEVMLRQRSLIHSVTNTIANFKKLGQAKMTATAAKSRIVSTKDRFEQCRTLDAKLRLNADATAFESHPYFVGNEFGKCEDAYDVAMDFLQEQLEEGIRSPDPSALNVSRSLEFPSHASLNLPKITLPTFDGSYDKWESFRDRFRSMIIGEASLSNVQRLHHLFSCLKGDAIAAIEHLQLTSDNFPVAWQILSSRYENKRRLISTHLNKLLTLPNVTAKSAPELRALRDKANSAIAALKNLDRPVDQWSDILVFLVTQKLDKSSREALEIKFGNNHDYSTYAELDTFLESRIRALDSILPLANDKPTQCNAQTKTKTRAIVSHTANAQKFSCPVCNEQHLLYQCSEFINKTPVQRNDLIRKFKRCLNCFSVKHQSKACTSTRSCKQCQRKHHTLLHVDNNPPSCKDDVPAPSPTVEEATTDVAAHCAAKTKSPFKQILLATARVRVYFEHGRFQTVRALIDQGSASSFITENVAQLLRLPKIRTSVSVTGIGETATPVRHAALITITPSTSESPAYTSTALILKSLTRYIPCRPKFPCRWSHLEGLHLADHDPSGSDPINLIIGADLFGSLLLAGVRKGSADEPTAQNTVLGWIISGPIDRAPTSSQTSIGAHHGSVTDDLDYHLRRFWEVEEVPRSSTLTPEDQACEEHFRATHYRNTDGRYVVRLPFKTNPPIAIGDSRHSVLQLYRRSETRLNREPAKAAEYHSFLQEYVDLQHMQRVSDVIRPPDSDQIVFLPHHAVFREGSATSRIRVVFNASHRSTNGTFIK